MSNEERTAPAPAQRSPVSIATTGPSQTSDLTQKTAGAHSVLGQIWSGGKMAAAIGSLAGFIGDFLEPLAPINWFLFLAAVATSIVLGLSWLVINRGKWWGDLDRWIPEQLFIFTSFLLVAFGGWFLLQRLHPEQDRGVLGCHFSLVAEAQDSLLQLKQDVAKIEEGVGELKAATVEIQQSTEDLADTSRGIKNDTAAVLIETTGIHADTSAIRESLSTLSKQRGLVASPTSPADHYHNATVHLRDGNHAAAVESFKEFFGLDGGTSFDAYEQYADLVVGKYPPARAKRMIESVVQAFPGNVSARLIAIAETGEDDEEARQQLTEMIIDNPDFLPAFLYLNDRLPRGLLIDDLRRDKLRIEFQAAGGAESMKSFVLNPAEGGGRNLLARGLAFDREDPVDPMRRLLHGVRADPDITLLWLGVNDSRPGHELILSFPGGTDVRLPLDSPDNPAAVAGTTGVPVGLAPGTAVALELPRYRTERKATKPAFIPRRSNDVRIFPHAGELEGVAIDPTLEVTVSYVDAQGRTYRFPKPVKLFGQDDGGGGMFAVKIGRRDSFDPTPVLLITPASPMLRIEVSGRAEGPFVPVPPHVNVPMMNEVPCGAVPFLLAERGSTKLWVKGTTEEGKDIPAVAVDVGVPPAVRWKPFKPVSRRPGEKKGDTVELKFHPPDDYSDFYIDRIAFSPDGEKLAAMMERAGLVVWDITSGRQTHLVTAKTGKTLAFSADGRRLTNGLLIVDLATSEASPCLEQSYDTFGAAVSASLQVAATIDRSKRLTIFDLPSGAETAVVELGDEHGFPAVVAVSPDARLVAVAGGHVDVVWLVDCESRKVRKLLEVPSTGITSMAFSPDSKDLLATGPESCLRAWNLSTYEDTAARLTLDDTSPEAIWTAKGTPLVADIGPAGLTVSNARTGESVAQVDGPVKKFALSSTGTKIAIAKKTSVVVRPLD